MEVYSYSIKVEIILLIIFSVATGIIYYLKTLKGRKVILVLSVLALFIVLASIYDKSQTKIIVNPQQGITYQCMWNRVSLEWKDVVLLQKSNRTYTLSDNGSKLFQFKESLPNSLPLVSSVINHASLQQIGYNKWQKKVSREEIDKISTLGLLLAKQGNYKEAVLYLEKATKLDPSYGITHFNLGTLYARVNRSQEAVRAWEKSVETDPSLWQGYLSIGNHYLDRKDYDKAIAYYEKVLKIMPDYSIVYFNIAVAWERKGDKEKTLSYLAKSKQMAKTIAEKEIIDQKLKTLKGNN